MTKGDVVILGSRGRLGTALRLAFEDRNLLWPPRETVLDWQDLNAAKRWFSKLEPQSDVHVAMGIIDPCADPEALNNINVTLPTRILEAAVEHGHSIVTYGTVMEAILPHDMQNHYISSKSRLAAKVMEYRAKGNSATHFRLHTLFGGSPPPAFMFTGHMFEALKKRKLFKMTSGRQYREYHHVQDVANTIARAPRLSAVIEMSHGFPIRLGDLASGVFEAFNASELLHIGARPDPEWDFYHVTEGNKVFEKSGENRPVIESVVEWFSELGLKRL